MDIIHSVNLARKYILNDLINIENIPEKFKLMYGRKSTETRQYYDTFVSNYTFNETFFTHEFANLECHSAETKEILLNFHNLLKRDFGKYEFETLLHSDIAAIDEYINFFRRYPPFQKLVYSLMGIKAAAVCVFSIHRVDLINCKALTTIRLEQLFSNWRHNYPISATSLYPILYQIGRLYSQYYIAGNTSMAKHFTYITELTKEMQILEINYT
ncbi:uncharacterized protein LOC142234706 [Haematobia irritans]|uniref:uncharacterized protein LOC142234706 n=1 Tax=Haematobia irritans TaxID=7368 RepID=UPI003F501018